jgi:hypothetical protein
MMPSYCKKKNRMISHQKKIPKKQKSQKSHLLLEPLHSILLAQAVVDSNFTSLPATIDHAKPRTTKDNVKVHSVDTNTRIVLDSQIDVLLDSETKVSVVGETIVSEFVFLHLRRIKSRQNVETRAVQQAAVFRENSVFHNSSFTEGSPQQRVQRHA